MPPESALSPVFQIASDLVDQLAALDPIAATSMGVSGHDAEMSDYSPSGQEAVTALFRSTLERLQHAPVTNARDRTAAEAMRDSLSLRIERFDAGEQLDAMYRSPVVGIRGSFDLMPRQSEEDWSNIAQRLALVPRGVASARETLDEGLRRGQVAAQRQVVEFAKKLEAWSGQTPATASFFDTLISGANSAGASAGLQSDLERAASAANSAFAELARYLRQAYLPSAGSRDGVGPDRYQLNSRFYNGITLDLEETYSWGWDELYRIEAEMAATCERILPGEGMEATRAFLESEPGRAVEGVEPFREWMQQLQDRTIDELSGVHFDIPAPVRRIEAMIAPPGGALAMYYTGPSEDFSRPGRTWYPTGGQTRFPLWGEVSIAYHEGVPGHHFQIATTKYLADELSRFQRLLGGTSGYVEGWALYAEKLMGELGYLENPDYYLGMLRAQAMRSVRVIVDIGMHLGLNIPASERFHPGETWDAQLGDIFARERSQFPLAFMQSEVTRYLGTPGQAISYKVGERCWLEAREDSKRRHGAAFELKAWHAAALNLGPMGLAQMQRELADV